MSKDLRSGSRFAPATAVLAMLAALASLALLAPQRGAAAASGPPPRHSQGDGYLDIVWAPQAKLIWTADLHVDNTILWRAPPVKG